jgi:hypothetical protein
VETPTKNNIPRPSTEIRITKTNSTNGIDGGSSHQSPSGQDKENLGDEFEKFFQPAEGAVQAVESNPSAPTSGELAAEGGVPVGDASTAVAHSASAATIQYASGNLEVGGKEKPADGLGSVTAAIVQGSVNGNTTGAAQPFNRACHRRAPADGAGTKVVKAKGTIPKRAKDHARWKLKQWRTGYRFTKESLDVIERELWKRLSEYTWLSDYPAWNDPRQEVNTLMDKLVREYAQYQ